MSLNVAREGVIARVLGSGLVGATAPPLKRARASIAEVFVGIVGCLAAAMLFSRYASDWRSYPISPAYRRVFASVLPAMHSAERAAGGNALTGAERRAVDQPYWAEAQRQLSGGSHRAVGAPVVFNQIEHLALYAAVIGLTAILVVALRGGWTNLARGRRRGLLLPGALLVMATGLFVVGQIATRSAWTPYGFSDDLRAILRGQTWEWPSVAYTLCPTVAVVLLCFGGAILLSRANLGVRACRWVGRLSIGVATCLGIALLCDVAWSLALSAQAPGYLFWRHMGAFGDKLFPLYLATVVMMAAGTALVIAGCTRCLRASSERS